MAAASLKAALVKELETAFGLQDGNHQPELASRLEQNLIDWAKPLMQPYRYKCLWGGRGSAKSWSVGDCLLIEGLKRRIRVLCAREFQISIKDSVHALLKARIESLGLEDFYSVQEYQILGVNGSQFIFRGVRRNVQSIKSMTGLTHCWIEEAQAISAESWQVLVPTIREEGSEIWVTFNPLHETDVVYQELVAKPRQNAYVERVNWDRNPFFPSVLDEERRTMLASDPDAYQHIWEGGFWEKSNAQVLAGKWVVEEFEPGADWAGPYQGADFGFAQDPTTLIRCWVHDGRLWVEYESYQVGLELDHTADRWLVDVPDCDRYPIRADSARPESISYLRRHGLPRIEGVKKWPGSVEDGIAHLRSYDKIVIHPRCRHTIEEARLYSYKTDRLSGEVLPVVLDAFNHCLVAGTQIMTNKGERPIEAIRAGDYVLTRAGFKSVTWSGVSDTNRKVFTVTTKSGRKIEATENHRILTHRGFVRVDALRYNDKVLSLENLHQCQPERKDTAPESSERLSVMVDSTITDIPTRKGETIEFTTNLAVLSAPGENGICIGRFGLIALAQFPQIITFITKTATLLTTFCQTWNAFPSLNTHPITQQNGLKKIEIYSGRTLIEFDPLQKLGTLNLKRAACFMRSWLKTLAERIDPMSPSSATNAVRLIKLTTFQPAILDFAQMCVSQSGGEILELMTSTLFAQFVESLSSGTNTQNLKLAVDYVQCVADSHVAKKVYDLTVEGQHEFFANGVLVHNCLDAARYSIVPLMKARGAAKRSGMALY